ncbi:hypothetical protein P153DRAFT_361198 [Dothidotthia symphoricarpi CBS 119687]|uniref:DUF7703 domain-containing protein n=1 Tax=Dothidotthia symphoricarpi CBS 119687 TaxID=1392245 RepID=A0A6A6A015_9PLEO|nr:uncharacterized protein P153DRAFT_361198 [Dothidotthia symphoricarpi CBS 119687]KAF2124493.1 hypothetical protein P153DRAFT_361198 [Dothidotthia symphoricarpi CBS 119687]
MASTQINLTIGPLASTLEVVTFVALTGMAWFNTAELFCTIFLTFKSWTGKYFYCLIVATLGVFVFQTNVFMMIFAPHLNMYGIIACIGFGWSSMVTGQSLVLWSRLHLVCRSQWKLRLILYMIVVNGVCMHGPQTVFSLMAVENNAINPAYKPFEIMEKISVAILSAQELIISLVYLSEAVRILRVSETLQRKGNRHRIKMLLLANLAIICIDICIITLEFLALWGVWCSFKGFGYSVKLKIEFAILNQLRDSIQGSSTTDSYVLESSKNSVGLYSCNRADPNTSAPSQPHRFVLKRQNFEQIGDGNQIVKTTKIKIRHDDKAGVPDTTIFSNERQHQGLENWDGARSLHSKPSSEIELSAKR